MIDPTEPDSIPEPVRREAFDAACDAARRVLAEHDCTLDDLAIYEMLDVALADIAIGLGVEPSGPVN